jgi:hypothetical protein
VAVITKLERKARRWLPVWQGDSESVAHIVAGRLEAEGIPVRVHGSTTPYRTSALALGGTWSILVPGGKANLARDILRENDEGHNLLEADDGEGLTATQRDTLRYAILGVDALVAAAVVLAALGSS